MSELEAHVYSQGYAYREGGDEYTVLLPNRSAEDAKAIMESFQAKLKKVEFFDIDKRIQVSVGICVVTDDSAMTDYEALQHADETKNQVKKTGKGKVAIYGDTGA